MLSVNWAEGIQKSRAADIDTDGMLAEFQSLGLQVAPFTRDDGERAGRLWQKTRHAELSLGDRACLSLGLRLEVPVLTGDRAWTALSLPLDVRVIRP